jgi:ectoine hydroxylase-related dioxygenase (phytanoyl-CoA dioxygenase family)
MNQRQTDDYTSDGYVTVSEFFSEADVRAVDEYLRAKQDVAWTDKGDDPLRESHYYERSIYDVCVKPELLDAIEALIGPDIVLLYTHIISKPPGGMHVAWHQDGPYWPRIQPKDAVTVWMALDDADRENGCMRVIPGTHAARSDLGQRPVDGADLLMPSAVTLPSDVVDESRSVDIVLKRGDASFHDSFLVHGSEPNRSTRRRAALTIRYVPSTTVITPRDDRKQYVVRGSATDNGNQYFTFGNDEVIPAEALLQGIPT